MNKIDKDYLALCQDILDNGTKKMDRTGTGTISVFGRQIRHSMKDGFPLLTTKKMYWKGICVELLWFLQGRTDLKWLLENDCNIWTGDAYKRYWFNWRPIKEDCGEDLTPFTQEEFINKIKTDDEFAKKWGSLGSIYGKQWRSWDVPKILTIEKGKIENGIGTEWGSWKRNPIDQIADAIHKLKTNPDDRGIIVSAWNVGELDQMVLRPCHNFFQFYTRELSHKERCKIATGKDLPYNELNNSDKYKVDYMYEHNIPTRAISLMWNQRSVDAFLGLPFNIASYALLLTMIADEVNMVPDELIGNLGDTHLYLNHIEQAKEQIERDPFELPTVHVRDGIFCSSQNDIILEDYQSHPAIKAPLSN